MFCLLICLFSLCSNTEDFMTTSTIFFFYSYLHVPKWIFKEPCPKCGLLMFHVEIVGRNEYFNHSCYFIPEWNKVSTIPLPILSLGSLNGVAHPLFYFYLFLKTFFMIYLLALIVAGRLLIGDLQASKDQCCCLWCPPTQLQLLLCLLHQKQAQTEHRRVSLLIR